MKTLARMSAIAAVLGACLFRTGCARLFVPGRASLSRELRQGFEDLGTTFIKFGQLVSMNPGIFPASFVEEFKKCLDNVRPLPWAVIQQILETELGSQVFSRFASIDRQPLSSASIAQVHRARLKDGTEVVLKVQRPGIVDIIRVDIRVLVLLFRLMLMIVPSLKPANPLGLIQKFDEKIHEELDFIQEGKNCERFAEIFDRDDDIIVPRVFWNLTTRRVLAMEYVEGIKITETERLLEAGIDLSRAARTGMKVLVKSAFGSGFFHGDMHAANIIVQSNGTLGFVDFGLMETLTSDLRNKVITLLTAVYRNDFTSAGMMMEEISAPDNDIDERFYDDVREVGNRYLSRSLAGRNWREFITETLHQAHRYHLRLPLTLILLLKQLLYLDGLGRMMDVNNDLLQNGAFFSEYFALLLQCKEQ